MCKFLVVIFSFVSLFATSQCTCDVILPMTFEATAGVEVIFYGRVVEVKEGCTEESVVVFDVEEEYKGGLKRSQEVLYICGTECGMSFVEGEQWIIYGSKNNAQEVLVDWCSRSRRKFDNESEDFYRGLLESTFDQEIEFLRHYFNVNESFDGGLKQRKYEKLEPKYIPFLLGGGLIAILLGLGVFKLIDKKKNKS